MFVPTPKRLKFDKVAQFHRDRHTPVNSPAAYCTQPPIFSGVPWRKRILSHSYHPPSEVYRVFSRLTPGLNSILESGIFHLSVTAFSHRTYLGATQTLRTYPCRPKSCAAMRSALAATSTRADAHSPSNLRSMVAPLTLEMAVGFAPAIGEGMA